MASSFGERAATAFDGAAAGAGQCMMRPEAVGDGEFLDDLAIVCSPFMGLLPDAMLRQQAAFQRIGQAVTDPLAMRRIILRDDRPIGRLALDWAPGGSRCIDIGILPERRRDGIGTALLGAWLAVADRLRLPATLSVRRDNPAVALYRQLGFVERDSAADPLLAMIRPRLLYRIE